MNKMKSRLESGVRVEVVEQEYEADMQKERKQEAQLPLRNRASATYFFLAKLISIVHSCL